MDSVACRPAAVESIPLAVQRLRSSFASGRTRPLEFRLEQLSGLGRLLDDCETEICQAIRKDLGRSELETRMVETSLLRREIALAQKRLRNGQGRSACGRPCSSNPPEPASAANRSE